MTSVRFPGLVQTVFGALYLNVLWIVAALPLVTAPAATGALLATMHRWQECGELPSARSFAHRFRTLFWRSQAMGLAVVAIVALAWVNVAIAGQFGAERRIFLVLMLAVLLNAAVLTIFGLPNLAVYDETVSAAMRRSVRMAAGYPAAAVGAGAIVFAVAVVSTMYPIALLAAAVTTAGAVELFRRTAARRLPPVATV